MVKDGALALLKEGRKPVVQQQQVPWFQGRGPLDLSMSLV